jgi:cell division control protein 6
MVGSVFKDKNKLSPHYVPFILPHREKHISILQDLFLDFLEKPGQTFQKVIQVLGGVGVGKTCTVFKFCSSYETEAKRRNILLKFIYTNCKMEASSRFLLYKSLLEKAAPEIVTRGLSPEEMLRQLLKYLDRENKFLLLVFDEIDYAVKRSKEKKEEKSIIYDITRLNEMRLGESQRVIGTIFISRDNSYRKLLDSSEKSTLGQTYIKISPYKSTELIDILKQRVDEAFKLEVVNIDTIEYISEITATTFNGDCRFALDVLLYSGLIADVEGSDMIYPEYVRRVVRESHPSIRSEDLLVLDKHEILTLIGIVRALKNTKKPYISIEEAWINYQIECEDKYIKKKSIDNLRDYLRDLDARGIIDYNKRRGIAVSGAATEDLDRILTTILRKMNSVDQRKKI